MRKIRLKGVVKGRVIELERPPDLPEGTNVVVEIEAEKEEMDPLFFGIWRYREDIGDGAEWVRKIRESQWRC